MGLLNIIRRMALREKQSIREISRRTGLSRNTIAKYLSAGTIEPTFTVPERPSKLDPFADKLAGWLKTEAGRSRKQRRTLKQLHADLMALGFTGSYGRVAAFARDWRTEQQTAGRGIFVPLSFRPGEAFQFDWSEDYALIGGERTKLQVAHIKLSHSRAFLIRAYLLQTHEMLFDAHWHGFRVFGGVPGRGIYDNMKTAVDRVGRGKERQVNIRFLAMTNHYVFAPEFCNPAAGWEKGQVEKNGQDARPRLWQQMPDFPDLAQRKSKPAVVTTNFDTFFERSLMQSYSPEFATAESAAGQDIPAPGSSRFHGIVHLHGRLSDPQLGLSQTELVLTSAQYGEAYLRAGAQTQSTTF
jgi:transposase